MADLVPEQLQTDENINRSQSYQNYQKQLIRVGATNQSAKQLLQISPRNRIQNLDSRNRTVKVVQSFRHKKLQRDMIGNDHIAIGSKSLMEGTISIKRNPISTSRNADPIFNYNKVEKSFLPSHEILSELPKPASSFQLVDPKRIENNKTMSTKYSKDNLTNFDALTSLISHDSDSKSIPELDAENKNLRKHLRELNRILDNLLEKHEMAELTSQKRANTNFALKPPEEQLRTYVQEILNNEKILEMKQEEVKNLKARLVTLKNTNYTLEIQDKIEQGKRQIQEIQKQNRELRLLNHTSGRNLANIGNDHEGVSNEVIQANLMEKDKTFIKLKNEKLKQEIIKFEEKENEQQLKIVDLEIQIEKLEKDCKSAGIELTISAEKQKYIELMNEFQELEENLKIITRRNENFLQSNYHKELREMKGLGVRDQRHLKKLVEILEEQSVSLKEVLSRESLQHDKSFQDVYGKLRFVSNESRENLGMKDIRLSGATPLKQRSARKDANESNNGLLKGLQDVLDAQNKFGKHGNKRNEAIADLSSHLNQVQRNKNEENLRRYKGLNEAQQSRQSKSRLKNMLLEKEDSPHKEEELIQRQESLKLRQRMIEDKLQKRESEAEQERAMRKRLEEEEAKAERRKKKPGEYAKKEQSEEMQFTELSQREVIDPKSNKQKNKAQKSGKTRVEEFASLKKTTDAIKKAIEGEPGTNEIQTKEGTHIKGESSVFILPIKSQKNQNEDPNALVFDNRELDYSSSGNHLK